LNAKKQFFITFVALLFVKLGTGCVRPERCFSISMGNVSHSLVDMIPPLQVSKWLLRFIIPACRFGNWNGPCPRCYPSWGMVALHPSLSISKLAFTQTALCSTVGAVSPSASQPSLRRHCVLKVGAASRCSWKTLTRFGLVIWHVLHD